MKPFIDEGLFRLHSAMPTTAPKSLPDYVYAQGVELRNGLRIYARKSLAYFSSGEGLEEYETGHVSQEVTPTVIGENQDTLDYKFYSDQDERKTPTQVLDNDEIIVSDTIDYDSQTSKDGRITVFTMRQRALVMREEFPFETRGIKSDNITFLGETSGLSYGPYSDYGGNDLEITRQGYYGIKDKVIETFLDHPLTNSLGYKIDYGDYDTDTKIGTCGTTMFASAFGTDSIAYAGLLR